MARASMVYMTPREFFMFRMSVFDTLRAVMQLTTLPLSSEGGTNQVDITYTKGEGAEYHGELHFYHLYEDGTPELKIPYEIPSAQPGPVYIPEGYNVEDSFDWFYAEVASLAYAMSGGKILPPDEIAEGIKKIKKTYVLQLDYKDEPDTYQG